MAKVGKTPKSVVKRAAPTLENDEEITQLKKENLRLRNDQLRLQNYHLQLQIYNAERELGLNDFQMGLTPGVYRQEQVIFDGEVAAGSQDNEDFDGDKSVDADD